MINEALFSVYTLGLNVTVDTGVTSGTMSSLLGSDIRRVYGLGAPCTLSIALNDGQPTLATSSSGDSYLFSTFLSWELMCENQDTLEWE
jgi:hypothetical protein